MGGCLSISLSSSPRVVKMENTLASASSEEEITSHHDVSSSRGNININTSNSSANSIPVFVARETRDDSLTTSTQHPGTRDDSTTPTQPQPHHPVMDERSQETLRRVQQNDDTLTTLRINTLGTEEDGKFTASGVDGAYSQLGTSIGSNTHLKKLIIHIDNDMQLSSEDDEDFFTGLIRNTSIHEFALNCFPHNRINDVGCEMLMSYQKRSSNHHHLTSLCIWSCDLSNGGDQVVATTLRSCKHLREVILVDNNMTDDQLVPMVEAVRGHRHLIKILLGSNRIGNTGCSTLARLLRDPVCKLRILGLMRNAFDNIGATTLINSLANNTMSKLRELHLAGNRIDPSLTDVLSKLLCDTSSINSIHSSNHTLQAMSWDQRTVQQLLVSVVPLLQLNNGTNKNHVAIKKILKYQPDIDMSPLFDWNMEGDGERDLKALPYVLSWFDRAEEAVADDEEGGESYNIGARRLSSMYQFAKAMPLMFVSSMGNNLAIDLCLYNMERSRYDFQRMLARLE